MSTVSPQKCVMIPDDTLHVLWLHFHPEKIRWSNLDVIQPGPYEVPGFLGIPAENPGIFWDLPWRLAAWNWFIRDRVEPSPEWI